MESAFCPGSTPPGIRGEPRLSRCGALPEAVRYCGREFSAQELELIRSLIAEDPSRHRLALSRLVCERLDWRRPDAQLKDMSCRVALLRMQRDGLIRLPPPQRGSGNGRLRRRRTPQGEPPLPIIASVHELPDLELRPPANRSETLLWREYVDRYHYLGYAPLPGAQLRYDCATWPPANTRYWPCSGSGPALGRWHRAIGSSAGPHSNARPACTWWSTTPAS